MDATRERRWRVVARQALATIDAITPRRGELWSFFLPIGFALLALMGMRCSVALATQHHVVWKDWYAIQFGEYEFWTLWAFGWSVGTRILSGWPRMFARLLFHLLSAVLVVFSILDLAFFQVSGSRGDLDSIGYALRDLERVLPVVASEIHAPQVAALVAVAVLVTLPFFRRWPNGLVRWRGRLSLLLLIPSVVMELEGRPKPTKTVRELQQSLIEKLFFEAVASMGDVVIEPTSADFVPLRVAAAPSGRRPNVVVVLLESVRANVTTPYAPDLPTTPNLARLALEGWKIDDAYAVVPHTSKALITTLCGDWPQLQTEIREASGGGLPGRCLPELMRDLGYRTAFFQTARDDFEDRVNLIHNLGFQLFRARATLQTGEWEKNNYFGIDDRAMLKPGVQWSLSDRETPFFAVYLTLASHHNYVVPKHWKSRDWPGVTGHEDEYYNAVNYVDDFLGRLIDGYKEKGLLDNTVFLILGDHGEGFGEHGRFQHDLVIYEEGLRIPMVVYGPGVLPGTGEIKGPRQQIDVMPTILELVGATLTSGVTRGVSLFTDVASDRLLYHSCWRAHRCIARRVGNAKFIDHYADMAAQAFDLASDPEEKKDRAGTMTSSEVDALRAETREWRGRLVGRFAMAERIWEEQIQRPDDSPAVATFGGVLSLLGCDVPISPIAPADSVWVRCRWRADAPIPSSWKLRGTLRMGTRRGTNDWTPANGAFPLWRWRTGWSVDDTFRVPVPDYMPTGKAEISVGWVTRTGGQVEVDGAGGGSGEPRTSVDVATVEIGPRVKAQLRGFDMGGTTDRPPTPSSTGQPR